MLQAVQALKTSGRAVADVVSLNVVMSYKG